MFWIASEGAEFSCRASGSELADSPGGTSVPGLTWAWLGAGVASPLNVLIRGADVYTPITIDKGINVARFRGPDDLLASGYIWGQNRRQLAYKPFVVAERNGRGYVIGFTQDPNVRAYLDGLNVIFMNAIFRGSASARPIR